MILEVADIRVQPGRGDEFVAAVQRGLDEVVSTAEGFLGAHVGRSVENPDRFVLQIRWARLEDHTETFRQGPLFGEWRAVVGPYFAEPPFVEHVATVAQAGPAG